MKMKSIKFYERRIAYFKRCLADPACVGFRDMCEKAIGYCEKRIWQILTMN